MESWQQVLRLIVSENKAFSLCDNDRNEFKIMEYFVDNAIIKKQIISWLHNLKHNDFSHKKNVVKCEELRQRGNKEFQNKKYLISIKYYTLSLQYAPWESEDLSLAFANRSAALFYLEKYEACIKDIKLALETDYPKKIMYKLYLRAAQCYLKLHKKNLMDEAIVKLNDCIKNDNIITRSKKEAVQKQVNMLLTQAVNLEEINTNPKSSDFMMPVPAFGQHPNILSASTALDLMFSEEKGRYVIANQDIQKGQILFVEKPFAFVLLDNYSSDAVCSNCCKNRGDVPVPCKFCASAVYCTEKCQQESWSMHHQWECFGNQIGIWDQIGIAHLTVRTFLTCCHTKDKKKFNVIQDLVTNIDKILTQDVFVYGVSALMMALYLSEFTNFFKIINIYEQLFVKFNNQKLNMNKLSKIKSEKWTLKLRTHYVSGILLRNMLQLICNGHAITRLNLIISESEKIATEYQGRVATAIYTSASMMNHSCDPNIINSFKDQYLVVKATKNIPANSEVLNCYGPHYRRMNRKDRQTALHNQYCFICECQACIQPALQNFADKFHKLNCEECNGIIESTNNSSFYCVNCEKIIDFPKSKLYELEEANNLYEEAEINFKLGNANYALEQAKKCLEKRKRIFYEYHECIALSYDFVGKILAFMGRWLESISYLEQSIFAVEERFGADSVELANELNKITDVCIQYLRNEVYTNRKEYTNILKKTRRFLNHAKEILILNFGLWNEACNQIIDKQADLEPLLKIYNL